jgi:F-type H+-transporting ATPase subunit epsilon
MQVKTFDLEILTPDQKIFKEKVESVNVNTIDGEMGILANHAPLCAVLNKGKIKIKLSKESKKEYLSSDGVVIIKGNTVSIHVKNIS